MGLITFSGAFILMLLTVPWREVKRWSLFGLISGLGVAIILLLVMQNWLGLWVFRKVDFFYLGRIPIILSAAWTPAEIFFAHFFIRYQNSSLRLLMIFFLPALAVASILFRFGTGCWFIIIGIMPEPFWFPWRFILGWPFICVV